MYTLGYIQITATDDLFCGAILVVDRYGIPLEFQYSEPLLPTDMQKALYGDSLARYIKQHILLLGLLKELATSPTMIMTNENLLLEIQGDIKTPLVYYETTTTSINELDQLAEKGQNEFMLPIISRPDPLSMHITDNFLAKKSQLIEVLQLMDSSFDILEPPKRILDTLDLIRREQDK